MGMSLAPIFGPIFGGYIGEMAGWRQVFGHLPSWVGLVDAKLVCGTQNRLCPIRKCG